MNKKEKKKIDNSIPYDQVNGIQQMYVDTLETDPKYSLQVDPINKYNLSDDQKSFIKYYVDFKNVNTVADIMKIKQEKANEFFLSYPVQAEIRRINMALYHRQFSARLVNLDEIGGYLTSLLTGINTPLADQPRDLDDRLSIIKLLIEINKLKKSSLEDPEDLMNRNLGDQLKDLSITTIKQMLVVVDNKDKNKVVNELGDNLTPEESAYLSTLPTEELLKIIDETNKQTEKE